MKKLVSLFIILILVCFTLPLAACENRPRYDYVFITDLHVVANSVFTEENYASYVRQEKSVHISEAILNSLVDEIIAKKYKGVFVSGDITQSGDEASHLAAAAAFKRLENAGIQVYVVNGNHDLPSNKGEIGRKISAARFKEIYNDFGYAEAKEVSPYSLGYVADINKNFRLIAVDNMPRYDENETFEKPEPLSETNIEWVKKQVDACNNDKVTPIILAHDTFINHFPEIAQIAFDRATTTQQGKLVKSVAEKGAKLILAGHDHVQDIITYKADNGNELYEVAAGSLVFFPCAYKELSLKKKSITVNTVSFDNVKEEYLPSVCPQEIRDKIAKGLQNYCFEHFSNYISSLAASVVSWCRNINVSGEAKAAFAVLADEVVAKVLNNPFYIKDEDNNTSLERILNEYGISMPTTQYKNLVELAPRMAAILFGGDENLVNAPDLNIIKYSLFSAFYYLDEASGLLAAAAPSYPVIDVDLDKLFKDGILECYDSNIVPFGLKLFTAYNYTVGNLIKGVIENDFENIGSDFVKTMIAGYTDNVITDVSEFFSGKNLLIKKLIDDGIWGNYASDYVLDTPPSDTYVVISLRK